MNLQNLTITSVGGEVHVLDSLNAALLQLKVKREANTIISDDNDLIIYVDTQPSSNPTNNRKQYIFEMNDVLKYYNSVSDELILDVDIKNNDLCFSSHVERKIGDNNSILTQSVFEELDGIPIVLFEGENYIYSNYSNANITIIYPKNTDDTKILLFNSIYAGHRKEPSGDFCLDDIYFKDAFTKTGDELDIEVNNASVDCITSNLNNFNLDSNGNLNVKTLGVLNGINVSSISSNNNKFNLDSNGNLSVKGLNVNGVNITGNSGGLTSAQVCDLIYPVGSIYMSVSSTNPGTIFGGTWTSWGTGRVPVAINTGDSDFSTVEKTGGNKSHTHTIGGHFHNLDGSNAYAQVNFTGGRSYLKGRSRSSWTPTDALTGTSTYSSKPNNSWGADVVGKTQNSSEFNSGTASNLMPYITCYMWKRTA